MAAHYDIRIDQGQTYELLLTYKTAAGEIRDLTDCTAAMQIRARPGESVVLDLADVTNGLTIDPLIGRIFVTIPDETTTLLPAGQYRYDLVIEFADGKKRRLISGDLKVIAGITLDE